MSDAALTTSQTYAEKLRGWRRDLQVTVTPVFSNVGECTAAPPLNTRGPFGVVFGQEGSRHRVYLALGKASPSVGEGLLRLGVERLWDIGPPLPGPAAVGGLPIERLGVLAPPAVSARLAQARVGLADNPLHVLTKSGIMAAYFAHGLLAVNMSTVGKPPDGIQEGRQFVHPSRLSDPAFEAQAVADGGFQWYRLHGLDGTVQVLLACFR
jgi:hypothetical protein